MQAPTYIERSQALLLMREQEQMQHANKMGKIATANMVAQEAKMVTHMMKKNRQDRKKTKDFLTNEKNITINKDNQILLNKLVEISSGKWSSVAPVPKKGHPVNRGKSVRVTGPTSLNMGVRKRETERIERENHAFAKRLFDKQAVLQKKGLDTDWVAHQKYKKQITKMPRGMKSQGDQFATQGKYVQGYGGSNMRSDPNLYQEGEGEGEGEQEQMQQMQEDDQQQMMEEEDQQQQPDDIQPAQETPAEEGETNQQEQEEEVKPASAAEEVAPATDEAPAESNPPAEEEKKDE